MKTLTARVVLGATILALVSRGASAQERLDPSELLTRVRQELRDYSEDANSRTVLQQREVQVLVTLKDAADSLSGIQLNVSGTKARAKLEEAERVAQGDPTLPEPTAQVLAGFRQLVEHPELGGPPDQVRARAFTLLEPLEIHVLQGATAIENEIASLRNLEFTLSQIQAARRAVSNAALRAAIDVRKKALKIR
jgi:hypothetical protein